MALWQDSMVFSKTVSSSFLEDSTMVDASRKKCEMTGCHTLVFTEVDSGHGHSGHGPHTHDEALSERRVIR